MRCPSGLFGDKKKIIEFYYNELSEKERVSLEEHLKKCNRCYKYCNEIERVVAFTKERKLPELNYSEYIVELRKKLDANVFMIKHKKKFSFSRAVIVAVWSILLFFGFSNYSLHKKQVSDIDRITQFVEKHSESRDEFAQLDIEIIADSEDFLDEILFPEFNV